MELVLGGAAGAKVHRLEVVKMSDEEVVIAGARHVALHAERHEVPLIQLEIGPTKRDAEVEREDVMNGDPRPRMKARDARGLRGEVLEGDVLPLDASDNVVTRGDERAVIGHGGHRFACSSSMRGRTASPSAIRIARQRAQHTRSGAKSTGGSGSR